jgi:hypothetical protein
MIDPGEFESLKNSVKRIEHAICGDMDMGHSGLVRDMAEMKSWRNSLKLRMAFVSGAFISVWELLKLAAEYFKPHEK